MRLQRRTNPLWGLVLLALAGVLLARALGYVPDGAFDLMVRAWPMLLVLAGLSFLLRGRVPFGSAIAVIASVLLVAGVVAAAYSGRASQQRSDYRQPIEQVLAADVTLLRLRVQSLATGVEILTSSTSDAVVTGEFVGSAENRVEVNYTVDADNAATLDLREVQPSGFPSLESIGRGTLRVEVPAGIPLDIEFNGGDGDVTLNMDGSKLERLNVFVTRGNVVVTLPNYQPVLSGGSAAQGTITTREGDLTVLVPPAVAARFELNREGSGIDPLYDANVYNYLVGDVLEARTIETANVVVRYTLTAPRGRIRLEVPTP